MAEVINMPRLSDTMEEGVVAKWLKQKGDKVEEGDILAEIETDKATMEFESFYEGTLLHIGIEEGETAPVDTLLAIIGEEGEDISELLKGGGDADKKKQEDTSDSDEDEGEDEAESDGDSDDGGIPEGVEIITMPRLSDTMEEGTVASWLKKEGDKVEEGDILAEIETDKATMEFESFYEGTLLKIGLEEGETAKVDSLLAIIGPDGTDVSNVSVDGKSKKKSSAKSEKKDDKKEEKSEEKESKSSEKKSSGSSKNGGRIFASPLAKKMAEDKGIDLSDVEGSGGNGRIVKKDIEDYKPSEKPAEAKSEAKDTAAASQPYVPAGEESFEEIKNSQMRKTIAKRLGESKFNAPHYYLTIEVDMANAMASRKQINEMPDIKVSFNDMVIKASAMALRKHPQVNSQWTGESMKIAKHIHMGVAVAVEEGLVVPVLKFADQMSMTQIGNNVKDVAGKARNKKLQPKDMEGSTFTVSNLGMFGIVEFTSIINQPNSAILSVGTIVEKPVVKNGEIVIGNTMKLTLACDHRTVDGATGAAFLKTLRTYLENPVTMLA
ncbi:pyruvate dehydrogenase complex dihydrolipoamide acetyltransferase [Salegentibacter salarius]|uniref:Acetyltransferase component of pyruvate dehydrogenase complex n=1 Tax=Salegentibacter salarius TaxID=435906 RepID=A0A2N0TYH9_9FLAO|nr:pyruvate dehydrogenase complex dihydrolipoamide acetyltransferase [Salegentibacter salarius]OEY72910.1 pyruvate dehydrogenase complex dihydrolipoamide acetyltransferase [Salegentibacter salarius]PKD19807.1 pyruvate dehydrogenase [Salegentibacter salarius]SLJ86890.1 pyruvate dehydrogenase E2 component (dihydrolipoamide acetyltransferase) [Salegentibacter salarius]